MLLFLTIIFFFFFLLSILVDIVSSIPNGVSSETVDSASLHGTTKSGATSGWINTLTSSSGTMAGISGQSTLGRKSGKEIIDEFIYVDVFRIHISKN